MFRILRTTTAHRHGTSNPMLVGAAFAILGLVFLVLNLRRGTLPFGIKSTRFAFVAISILPPVVLFAFGLTIIVLTLRTH